MLRATLVVGLFACGVGGEQFSAEDGGAMRRALQAGAAMKDGGPPGQPSTDLPPPVDSNETSTLGLEDASAAADGDLDASAASAPAIPTDFGDSKDHLTPAEKASNHEASSGGKASSGGGKASSSGGKASSRGGKASSSGGKESSAATPPPPSADTDSATPPPPAADADTDMMRANAKGVALSAAGPQHSAAPRSPVAASLLAVSGAALVVGAAVSARRSRQDYTALEAPANV